MMNTEPAGAEPGSGLRRGNLIQWALLEARTRHDRCEALDLRAGTSDISGSHFLYCGLCGQKLLEWGGDDAE
jgi:hypothetical protein